LFGFDEFHTHNLYAQFEELHAKKI